MKCARIAWVVMLMSAWLATGCGSNGPASVPVQATGLLGDVHGGQQPISDALIQLYAVGTTGDGSAAIPLISATITTSDGTSNPSDSNANAGNSFNALPAGSFSIPAEAYTCPSASTEVYIVAIAGNPGLSFGTNNSAATLMAALGECGSLSGQSRVIINEVTTVGSIVPVSAFMTSYSALGSAGGDAAQLNSALSEVSEYTNTEAGSTPGLTLPDGYSASSTALQTLADIIAGCINSSGGVAGDSSVCGELFTLATPPAGQAPTDTIGAVVNIENNPTQNVSQIFDLLGSVVPFEPTLMNAPTSWALPITSGNSTQLAFQVEPSNTASGNSISPAVTVAIEDASGNVQTSATNQVTLTIGANPSGGTLSGAVTVNAIDGIATFSGVSIDKAGTGYSLSAASTGLTGTNSNSFNITASTAAKLAFTTQPTNTASGISISPAVAVSVEDASGNVVTTSTVPVTMAIGTNPGSGTLSGTTTINAVNGIATFSNLSINNVANSYKLAASSGSLTGVNSNAFNITGAAINVGATVVGNNLFNSMTLSLPIGAPATETMTLTSNDPTHFLLTISAATVGTASVTVQLTKGSTAVPTIYLQGENYTGTTAITGTVTASASGFADGIGTESLYPSGIGFESNSFSTTTLASPTQLTVGMFVLNPGTLIVSAQSYLGPQAPVFTYTISSDTPATGTITGSPATFPAGLSQYYDQSMHFQPVAAGTSKLTLNPPSGYFLTTSSNYPSSITATVTAPSITMGNQIVGNNLTEAFSVSLQSPPTAADTFTITSNDPTHFLISTSATVAGSATLTIPVAKGAAIPQLYLEGQNYTGSTAITSTLTITDTSNAYGTGTGNVNLYPSGLAIATPSFSTTTLASPKQLEVQMMVLSPGTLTAYQQGYLGPQAASPCTYSIASGTPATGTITGSPATLTVDSVYGLTTYFQPAGAGTSTLTLTQPAGYYASTSSNYPSSITATVTAPSVSVPNQIVGNNLITNLGVTLQSPPTSTDTFTITSNDPTHFLVSTSSTAVGSASVTVSVATGGSIPQLYLQGQNYSGTTAILSTLTVTDSLNAYSTGTGNVSLYPSGLGLYNSPITTTTFSNPAQITVGMLVLSPGTLTYYAQAYLGPQAAPVSYAIASGTTATGTITGSPAIFPAAYGTTYGQTVTFQPVGAGTSTITLTEPAGYSTPASAAWPMSFTATVTAPKINVSNVIVGNNLITPISISAQTAPPADETMTITTGDSTHFLLSTSASVVGSASLTVTLAKNGTLPTIYIEGQNFNENATAWTTTLTASAPGYTVGTATLSLYPSGVVFYSIGSVNTTTTSSPTTLQTAIIVLNPGTLTEALNGNVMNLGPQAGGAINYTVTSGTPATGTISGSPGVIGIGSSYYNSIRFQPVAAGTSVLTIAQPSGFDAGSSSNFMSSITATVTGP